MSALKIKNLVKSFQGVRAIDGLTLEIPKGMITGVIGPNGSGKSTLINLLTGMFKFDSGSVAFGSAQLSSLAAYEVPVYGVTRTFQEVRLFNQMTVLDNILVVLTERGALSSIFDKHNGYHLKIAQELLEKVNLWQKKDDLAGNLSYGQRKLLEVARVLATKSDIYFFDEPFAGMFPEMIKIVTAILKELRAEGKTVVLVEHNMNLIRELSDHLVVLDSGTLLAEGKPKEVLERPEVIEAYLGE